MLSAKWRAFIARTMEHTIASVHLWQWLFYDFGELFPLKDKDADKSHIRLIYNSTTLAAISVVILVVIRSLRHYQVTNEYRITHFNSYTMFTLPWIIHVGLSWLTFHRIDNEIDLPDRFKYITSSWMKCVFRVSLMTFSSVEFQISLRCMFRGRLTKKHEVMFSIFCYFICIHAIRILFHVHMANDK